MGVTSCATLPFLPGTHVFSTVFKLLQANSTLFKHLWLVTSLVEEVTYHNIVRAIGGTGICSDYNVSVRRKGGRII